jgi:enoyl-CoA hydratase/carnithine racemase
MDDLVVERRGGAVLVRIDRPVVHNAITPEMFRHLREIAVDASADTEVMGLVLTGTDPSFSSGADIRRQSEADPERYEELIGDIQGLTEDLRSSDVVSIAALNGPAYGGGFEVALACDWRVAAPGAAMGFPEIRLGLTVTSGVTHLLPRLVGASFALELLLTGRMLDASDALARGLVDRVSDDPLEEALSMIEGLERLPRRLVGLVKAGLYAGAEGSLADALRAERETILEAFGRPEAKEGMRAFLERRPPRLRPDAPNR